MVSDFFGRASEHHAKSPASLPSLKRHSLKPEGPQELVKHFVRGHAGPINILGDLGYFHLVDYVSPGSQVSCSNLG